MDILCIVNQKGGVGKTTTSINLSAGLANLGRKVLLIDMDPQGNSSSGLGIYNKKSTLYHVLTGEKSIADTITSTSTPNLSILPAYSDLAAAEVELVNIPRREYVLYNAMTRFTKHSSQPSFDYIVIDLPPSLSLLTINALTAANSFIVPLQCEYYALEGLSQLLNTVSLIQKNLNTQLKMQGILLTMFDVRNKLSHHIVAETRNHFDKQVFKTIIPRNVKLSEAPSHGLCIFDYDSKSVGALCYKKFAKELDRRMKPNLIIPYHTQRKNQRRQHVTSK